MRPSEKNPARAATATPSSTGIAAALSDEDEISLHLQDTLNAGDGLCNVEAATALVEDAPERIEELMGELLGYSAAEIARLKEAKVLI